MLEKWKLYKIIIFKKELTDADKMVCFALLDHQGSTGKIFPSNKRLQLMTGLSDRQINRSTKKLHDLDLIHKEKTKGKNFYTPNFHIIDKKYDRAVLKTMTPPSPPTKLTISNNKNKLTSLIKNLTKRSNPNYRAVVNNGLSYQENRHNKIIKQVQQKLSQHQFTQWMMVYEEETTRDNAMRYATEVLGCK
jgi:predicted transcriptional regulator|tara:strand:- start:188 stop:760 length:573 start_codon:yes stop_codon:yes gene_type:complete